MGFNPGNLRRNWFQDPFLMGSVGFIASKATDWVKDVGWHLGYDTARGTSEWLTSQPKKWLSAKKESSNPLLPDAPQHRAFYESWKASSGTPPWAEQRALPNPASKRRAANPRTDMRRRENKRSTLPFLGGGARYRAGP